RSRADNTSANENSPAPRYSGASSRDLTVAATLRTCSLALCFWIACLPLRVTAHDSPEHVVEQLTARIIEQGKSADLLWRRAAEYRELGVLDSAGRDLREAIALKPDFLVARADLGKVQLRQGKASLALRTLNDAVSAANDEPSRAPLYLTRAEI